MNECTMPWTDMCRQREVRCLPPVESYCQQCRSRLIHHCTSASASDCDVQAKGSRPLIFSQWTQVLDILEWLMEQLQLPYLRLDGSTVVADRQAIVDQYATLCCTS